MRIIVIVARLLLGLAFTVFGLNGFLQFIPHPVITGDAGVFFGVLFTTHYLYFTTGVQLIAGLLLLADLYVPFALVLLAAMISNILVFHITMMPEGLIPFPVVVTVLWFIVAWPLRAHFAPLFVRKAR